MRLGDIISVRDVNGQFVETRVEAIRYSSGSSAVYRRLNRWQQWCRRFTPARWRRPLLIQPAELPTVTINTTEDPVGKTLAELEQMKSAWNSVFPDTFPKSMR